MDRDAAILEATRRLTEYFQPERIYLFGPRLAARRGLRAIWFMVLLSDEAPERLLRASPGDFNVRGLGPVDVLIWRAREFDRWLPLKPSLPAAITREGRLLYERTLAAA